MVNPILVEFIYYDSTLKVMQRKKKITEVKNSSYFGYDIGVVYINKNLTLFGKELLHHARNIKNTFSWKFNLTRG